MSWWRIALTSRLCFEQGTGVAALTNAGGRVEAESPLRLLGLGGVALVTMLDEHRADLLLEEVNLGVAANAARAEREHPGHEG